MNSFELNSEMEQSQNQTGKGSKLVVSPSY